MSDPQDEAEQLDEDVVGDVEYPPDHPLGVDETRGVDIDQDDSVRESLAEREARLVPDGARPADRDEEPADAPAEESAMHVRGSG